MEPTTNDTTPDEPLTTNEETSSDTQQPEAVEAPKTIKPLFAPNNPKDTKLGKRHQSATKARPKRRVKTKRPKKKKKKR